MEDGILFHLSFFFDNICIRNAAKARNRDIAGRSEKGHFARQRYKILCSVIKRNEAPITSGGPGRPIASIDLAHARKLTGSDEDTLASHSRAINSLGQRATPLKDVSTQSKILSTVDIEERR